MKTHTKIALLISFISGLVVQLYNNDHPYRPYFETPISPELIAFLIGGALGFMVGCIVVPLIISTIIYARTKEFPQFGFTVWVYILTACTAFIIINGHNVMANG